MAALFYTAVIAIASMVLVFQYLDAFALVVYLYVLLVMYLLTKRIGRIK